MPHYHGRDLDSTAPHLWSLSRCRRGCAGLVSGQEMLCTCSSRVPPPCSLLSGWFAEIVEEAYSLLCADNLRLSENRHLSRHPRAFPRPRCMSRGISPRGPLGDGCRDAHDGCSLAKTRGQVLKKSTTFFFFFFCIFSCNKNI